MKILHVFLVFSATLLPAAALAQNASVAYPARYAGGSLRLNHHRVRAALGKDEVIFMQGGRRIAVPVKNITEISFVTQNRYVGVSWTGADGNTAQAQVLLKLSRGEYPVFLAALEKLTGIKAVNTNQVPTVVRYAS
jgi:hypothetical protein